MPIQENVTEEIETPTPNPCEPLRGYGQRIVIAAHIFKLRVREHLEFDSRVVAPVLRCVAWIVGYSLFRMGSKGKGFALLSSLHRSGRFRLANKWLENRLLAGDTSSPEHPIAPVLEHAITVSDTLAPAGLRNNPNNAFPSVAIVLRSPTAEHKGVLNLSYSYVYPWFHRHFDVEAISQRYHFVLEPSWSGFCSADLLTFTRLKAPVFVQAIEPYDAEFLTRLGSNLVPVPIAANWWTDAEIFKPMSCQEREYDFLMVAGWADFKRHHRFFRVVARLAASGRPLQGACVGYPQGRALQDIQALAAYYGVADLIDFYDRLRPCEVAQLLSRSRVSVLWSRREGFNRAVVESLFVNIPVVMREGFNYGFRHEYINEQTGSYVSEFDLGNAMLEIVHQPSAKRPRAWVRERMTPVNACKSLESVISQVTGESGSKESSLTPKRNTLNMMEYISSSDMEKHRRDYAVLRRLSRK